MSGVANQHAANLGHADPHFRTIHIPLSSGILVLINNKGRPTPQA